ncbi:MAG: pyridoxal phosphate-dependent aminotransferase [Acidobacteriota bacterium]
MPRHPHYAPVLEDLDSSVFSALAARISAFQGETYPLHVGDTWLEPAVGARMEDLTVAAHPGMHRYASPHGLPALVDRLAQRVADRTGMATVGESVLLTTGATGALGAVAGALLEPGDEVLILAPYWPLIPGIVRAFHGRPVAVPFFESAEPAGDVLERLAGAASDRTVALYLNTPNNPTGQVIPKQLMEAIVALARQRGWWLWSDEVYEDLLFQGEQVYCRTLAPERTFSAYSFSKAYGMAGNRCGYLVGPPDGMGEVRKISTHTFYSSPTAGQLAALAALGESGQEWLRKAKERYAATGQRVAERLGQRPPAGGTFLFLDVAEHLDERGLLGFLEDCADRGLFLAPGPSCGPYPTHLRLCFTSAPPDIVERGVSVLREMLS